MNKIALVATSILGGFWSLTSSTIASMVEENREDVSSQYLLRNFQDDLNFSDIRSEIIEKKPLKKSDYDRIIAQKINHINYYSSVSEKERSLTQFEIGKLYYEYSEITNELNEKAALLEQSKRYFEKSKSLDAKHYLDQIANF